jgi:NADH dehydrogenase
MAGTVTVFGGTGFLGRRVVLHLRDKGFSVRVASRHPERGREHFGRDAAQLRLVRADIHDDGSVAEAIAGADGVVNAVSLYVEHGKKTFQAVHVEAAERVARQAHKAGIKQLVHVSGIGSDGNSRSKYIKARGQGELAVRTVFSDTTLIRPAVMFGPDDAFLTTLLGLLRRLPVYPMFGRGETRLQPAYVEDVSEAIARSMQRPEAKGTTFECGGPRIYSYEELLRNVARCFATRS